MQNGLYGSLLTGASFITKPWYIMLQFYLVILFYSSKDIFPL